METHAPVKRGDAAFLAALALLGAFIWLRDRSWLAAPADTLPILVGLPLFAWLGAPWRRSAAAAPSRRAMMMAGIGIALFPLGVLADSTTLLALGWTLLLGSWCEMRRPNASRATPQLLVLAFISFPWIANDFERLGWWFRLSGAAAVGRALTALDFAVVRQGTFLTINGFSVSVEPACSGLNGLQSLLLAGVVVAYVKLKHTRWFWWNLPVLVAAAWLANFLRIFSAAIFGAKLDPAVALRWIGPMHTVSGWLALCGMFVVCWLLISGWERLSRREVRAPGARTAVPWLEMAVLGYCGWRARVLFAAWFDAPFDRLGWLAFAIWLAPLGIGLNAAHRSRLGNGGRRPWIAATGLALTLAGDLGDLNFCHDLGLVFVLIALAPRAGRALWGLSAIAWLPALGWVASRAGISPAATAVGRVGLAVAGVTWALAARRQPGFTEKLSYVGNERIAS
jgi:exosortase/archaeosortase family protein